MRVRLRAGVRYSEARTLRAGFRIAGVLWRIGDADHWFIYGAFEMFRNFDGSNGSFGDTSIRATTSNVETSSVYASVDAGNTGR